MPTKPNREAKALSDESRRTSLWSSLAFRLLLVTLVTALLAVLATAWVASRTASDDLEAFLVDEEQIRAEVIDELKFYGESQGSWDGVVDLAAELSWEFAERIVLVDDAGTTLIDTDLLLLASDPTFTDEVVLDDGAILEESFIDYANGPVYLDEVADEYSELEALAVPIPSQPSATLTAGGETIEVYLGYEDFLTGRSSGFLSDVNVKIVIAVLVVGAAVIGITVLTSTRLLRPISRLTTAARRLEDGDLSQRVEPSGSGELSTLGEAFNEMAASLETNEEQRRRLVSDVAHELRTPLNNIIGYTEAVADGVVKPTPDVMGSIHEESIQLQRLVDDLQQLSLAESGALHLHRVPVSVADIIEAQIVAHRARAEAAGIDLHATTGDHLPLADVDPPRIGQVLRNLIDNAIRHTPEGGSVDVGAVNEGGFLRVWVRDTGEGIPAADLPHVFDRFYRADPSRHRDTGGRGLGLAIAESIVTAHGGQITVTSERSSGTTFQFTLPESGS